MPLSLSWKGRGARLAKCRTAEQVPRAEERAFSFPMSQSLALRVSHQRTGIGGGGGRQKSERSPGVSCHCELSWDGLGSGREGSGSHQPSAVFTRLYQGIKKKLKNPHLEFLLHLSSKRFKGKTKLLGSVELGRVLLAPSLSTCKYLMSLNHVQVMELG